MMTIKALTQQELKMSQFLSQGLAEKLFVQEIQKEIFKFSKIIIPNSISMIKWESKFVQH